MTDLTDKLATTVHSKLRNFGTSVPSRAVLRTVFEVVYLASLKTEEGRFVKGSVTFANPAMPEASPPLTRRANYPSFTKFGRRLKLTVESLVKLARAIDKWSGSIAVYGTTRTNIEVWGVVDQLVGQNRMINRESSSAFENPGTLTVTTDGVGDLSAYHGSIFLGALRQNQIITRENDALRSTTVTERILPTLGPIADAIAHILGGSTPTPQLREMVVDAWASTVARLCIGLQRLGTGGSLLITPAPLAAVLSIGNRFPYRRLGDATCLQVLDDQYARKVFLTRMDVPDDAPANLVAEEALADIDAEDRSDEVTGAAKVVTSLAAVDGLVLLDQGLGVVGFGVKIGAAPSVSTVYDGPDFVRRGTRAKKVDLSRFGTRHTSMLRYCRLDREALGVVVSQDGHVRLITTVGRSLTLWSNVKLLDHENYTWGLAQRVRSRQLRRRLGVCAAGGAAA